MYMIVMCVAVADQSNLKSGRGFFKSQHMKILNLVHTFSSSKLGVFHILVWPDPRLAGVWH